MFNWSWSLLSQPGTHWFRHRQTIQKRFNMFHYELFPVECCVFWGPHTLRSVKFFFEGPRVFGTQKLKTSRDTPGVSWRHHGECSVETFRPITFKDPAVIRWTLRLFRLRIFLNNQGPVWSLKTRALCESIMEVPAFQLPKMLRLFSFLHEMFRLWSCSLRLRFPWLYWLFLLTHVDLLTKPTTYVDEFCN